MSIIGSVLAGLNQFYGGVKPLVWPRALALKALPILNNNDASFVPDIAAADGSGWTLTGTTVARLTATGATTYSIAATEINAGATGIAGVVVDYAAGRIYILADNGANNIYLGFSTLAAKAITLRGAGVASTLANRVGFMDRLSSGDFFISSASGVSTDSATLTEATGAVGASSPLRPGGVNTSVSGVLVGGFYVSADRSVVMDFHLPSGAASGGMRLHRGGGAVPLSIGATNFGAWTAVGGGVLGAVMNGDAVAISTLATMSARFWPFPRHFSRADFDAFLQRACDFAGMPK